MSATYKLLLLGAVLLTTPAAAERRVLTLGGEPQRYAGLTYVGAGVARGLLGASCRWHPSSRRVEIRREGRWVAFRTGSRMALVNGRLVRLARPTTIEEDQVLVPLRMVGDALGLPVAFEEQTGSLLVKSAPDREPSAVPLRTSRKGIVLHSPAPGSKWHREVRVAGQANTGGQAVVLQLQTRQGEVLAEGEVPASSLGEERFTGFLSVLIRASSSERKYPARIIAFTRIPAAGSPYRVSIPITFSEQ